ncbi:MAG: porin family protein [Rhodobacteraceae bacterium]|nr:porin family protein [Paracoccaceae bacterium]
MGYGTTNLTGSDGSGFAYGVNGGYRYDFGQFVAGAEYAYDTTGINAGAGVGLDHSNTLKLQAGYDLGQTLVYGTVGTERAHFSGGAGSQDGLVAGVGVDYQLSDRMTAGAELLRHNYGSFDGTGIGVDGTTVAAKVGFRF